MPDIPPFGPTLDHVRQALALPGFDPLAAQERMAPTPRPLRRPDMPGNPKLAAVLILLYPLTYTLSHPGTSGEALHFALMRRTEYPGVHSGQISLPGGKLEPGESYEQAALRETQEEFGVDAKDVQLLGSLTPLYVPPSDFLIQPIVGSADARPIWLMDPNEVAEMIEVPLLRLYDDSIKSSETIERNGNPFHIPFYSIGAHKVWGATAIILSEFEMRLRTALSFGTAELPKGKIGYDERG